MELIPPPGEENDSYKTKLNPQDIIPNKITSIGAGILRLINANKVSKKKTYVETLWSMPRRTTTSAPPISPPAVAFNPARALGTHGKLLNFSHIG